MIKSGGENVSSREVEEVLFEHSDVAEVAVFGIEHPRWVEAVVAAVVPRPGSTVQPEELIGFARARLAGFKCPQHVLLLETLQNNTSRKITKRDLRQSPLAIV